MPVILMHACVTWEFAVPAVAPVLADLKAKLCG
jgi:hypothetical protein